MDSDLKKAVEEIKSLKSGQVLIKHLLDKFNLCTQTFSQGDPYRTAFNEGKRSAALYLIALLEADVVKEATESYTRIRTKQLQGVKNVGYGTTRTS